MGGTPPCLVHSPGSGVVGAQGQRRIVVVPFQQRLQQLGSGLHVLLRIERIVDVELLGGGGHQLHQTLRASGRERARPAGGFLVDHRSH